jgi:hypothetical protein
VIDPIEEYELSECAEKAVNLHWPKELKPSSPVFERRMIELQLALIKCKTHVMYPSDRRRALNTVKFLRQRLKEC